MPSKRKKPRRRTPVEVAASVPSPVLLAARVRSGAGRHTRSGTRSTEKRRAIAEAS